MKILPKPIATSECIAYPNTQDLYIAEDRLDDVYYTFDSGFILLARYALSTFCISEMSTPQKNFFEEWLNYSSLLNSGSREGTSAVIAFDYLLLTIAECIPDPGYIICGNSNIHVYIPCTN